MHLTESSAVIRARLYAIQLTFHQRLGSNKECFKAVKCRAAYLQRNTEQCDSMRALRPFRFFTKFFPHQMALTHNYATIKSSRRVPKGEESSNSVAWWEYSAAIWALMVRSHGLWQHLNMVYDSTTRRGVRAAKSTKSTLLRWQGWKFKSLAGLEMPRDSMFSCSRRGPQLAFCLWGLCSTRIFFKPLTGGNVPSRKTALSWVQSLHPLIDDKIAS